MEKKTFPFTHLSIGNETTSVIYNLRRTTHSFLHKVLHLFISFSCLFSSHNFHLCATNTTTIPSKTTPLDLILLLFFSVIINMKISALASLLGVAATTFLPGVAASEVVSAPDISFMSDFVVLLYVGLCVMGCQSIDNMMMPDEGVYTIRN